MTQRDCLLELGPAGGIGTAVLAREFHRITVVEAAPAALESVRALVPHAEIHQELFEKFAPDCRYNMIVMGHVLEHVIKPVETLVRYREFLQEGGLMLSRFQMRTLCIAALELNWGSYRTTTNSMSMIFESDTAEFTLRCPCGTMWRGVFAYSGGFSLKTFSNGQIEKSPTQTLLKVC